MKSKSSMAQPKIAGTATKIQHSRRQPGLRQKLLQIRVGDVEAQPAFGRLKVRSVSRCIPHETFVHGMDGHFFRYPKAQSVCSQRP